MDYIKLTSEQASQLNDIMYNAVVSSDGGTTFKFPFQSGTTAYIDVAKHERAYRVDERMLAVAQSNPTVADLIADAVTREQAVTNGWLPQPTGDSA